MKSDNIILALTGGAVLTSMFHHGDVYRDVYRNREDCQRDWQQNAYDCESTYHHGSYMYWGPSYVSGSRPLTSASYLVKDKALVKRSGFGRSGARFSGGG